MGGSGSRLPHARQVLATSHLSPLLLRSRAHPGPMFRASLCWGRGGVKDATEATSEPTPFSVSSARLPNEGVSNSRIGAASSLDRRQHLGPVNPRQTSRRSSTSKHKAVFSAPVTFRTPPICPPFPACLRPESGIHTGPGSRGRPFPSRTISRSRPPGILRRCPGDFFPFLLAGRGGRRKLNKFNECGDPNRTAGGGGGATEDLGPSRDHTSTPVRLRAAHPPHAIPAVVAVVPCRSGRLCRDSLYPKIPNTLYQNFLSSFLGIHIQLSVLHLGSSILACDSCIGEERGWVKRLSSRSYGASSLLSPASGPLLFS